MSKNKNEELLPYYEKAKELLDYNPEDGFFTWKLRTSNRIKVGDKAGCVNSGGYNHIKIDGRFLKAHRLAWYFIYNKLPNLVDHINQVRDDNRIINLRPCDHSENSRNRGKNSNNKSGYKGVSWNKQWRKWKATINIKGEATKHLGYFDCPKEASEAYENKAKEINGEFYYGKI